MSITDLLGLNSPRGLLNFGNSASNGIFTPTSPTTNTQFNLEEAKFSAGTINNASLPIKQWRRKLCSSSSSNNDQFISACASRSTSFSDSCGSSSPLTSEQPPSLSSWGSDSPESDGSSVSSPDGNGSLTEILNLLTLNENISQGILTSNSDLDLSAIQNLQALQTSRYLQQTQNLLGSLSPACTHKLLDKWNGRNNQTSQSLLSVIPENSQLDRAARFHKSAASLYDAPCTWSGCLPPRTAKPTGYSSKVFLGGVPWDISEAALVQTFKQFGPIRVEWPGKEKQASQPKGYAYIIFESEKSVKSLLQACNDNTNTGNWYFKISSKRMKSKEVQVIPWILNDSNFTKSTSQKLDPGKTVFVGALHGMLNAEGLAKIMNDLFDGVVYAGIDTDKYKYPIGSGRITFNNARSYMRAVTAGFVEIRTTKFTKKVQVDPYLEDSLCSICGVQQGPYFCRELICFRYYCRVCWQWQHNSNELRYHKPLMRNSKNSQGPCPPITSPPLMK